MMRCVLFLIALCLSAATSFAQGTQDPHAGHTMPTPANATPSQTGAPVPPLTDADRAAAFPQDLHGHTVHDDKTNYFVLFDQFEWQTRGDSNGLNWDNKSWIGGDLNRVWIHSEGATNGSAVEEAEAHVTYGRSIARWWDLLAGVRYDVRPGPSQAWAAFGIQGLAPQWFDVQATLYVGESAATLARFEVEYELLMTQRLVLQPLVELNIYGKSIDERGIGAGVSSAEAGLRLRYEIRREFAPYIGAVWHSQFLGTADFSEAAGRSIGGWHLAAGVRTWF